MEQHPTPIEDNLELLNIMLEDTNTGPDLFKPTNYWSFYEKTFVPELNKRPEARAMLNALIDYFQSDEFTPKSNLSVAELISLVRLARRPPSPKP